MSERIPDIIIGSKKQRLKILSQNELDDLYQRPHFTQEEREQYFALSADEQAVLDVLQAIKSKIFFVLQLGYFKARKLFFLFTSCEVKEDIKYLQQTIFSNIPIEDFNVSKKTRLKHQRLILSLCRYSHCNMKTRNKLAQQASQAAVICGKPIYIFRQLLHFLKEHQVVSPAYSSMQDIVGKALTHEQNRMAKTLREQLQPSNTKALNALMENVSSMYQITSIKNEPKGFSVTEIKGEIKRGEQIRDLYLLSQRVLPLLEISNESIKYYASLVDYYSVFRLKRFDSWIVYIYLLCFIHHRYQRHFDNLLTSFIFHVRKFTDATKSSAKERVYKHHVEANQDLHKAAKVLKFFTTDNIPEDAPFHEVQAKAFAIIEREKLDDVAKHITSKISFDETAFQWEYVDSLGLKFKHYLRPVLSTVNLKGAPAQYGLLEGLDFLKTAFSKNRPLGQYPIQKVPTSFIPDKIAKYLYESLFK